MSDDTPNDPAQEPAAPPPDTAPDTTQPAAEAASEPAPIEAVAEAETPETAESEGEPAETPPSDVERRAQGLRILEAVLFAATEPVAKQALAARLPEGSDVDALIADLEVAYAGRGVNVVRVGGKLALRTAPDLAPYLEIEKTVTRKPSRASVETLAIIAYHQPITRSEIEEIRGVGLSKGTLDSLLEAGWIKPKGHRETPGRPVTWVTTDAFLEQFGLDRITDLPGLDELKAAGLLDARPAVTVYSNTENGLTEGEEEETQDEDEASLEELAAEGDSVAGEVEDDAGEAKPAHEGG